MKNLVFIDPAKIGAVPFTTSEVIAEVAKVQHHAIQVLTQTYESDIKEFGVISFEMRKPPEGSKGGRPELIYHYNEEQATLLMTYLKNTEPVRAFKKELVRQFYAMRKRLTSAAIAREARKPTRRELTDAIRDCIPDSPHKGMMYKHYTDLAYKAALGKNAAQLRKERNAPEKVNLAEYLTAEESEAVRKAEGRLSVLLECGMDYQTAKAVVLGQLRAVN